MKTRIVVSLLAALGALLLFQIPSEGLPQAGHPAAAPARRPAAPANTCQQAVASQAFCADPSNPDKSRLCPYLTPDSPPQIGYTAFTCPFQAQFDNYSWQTLVALNWPADVRGQPCVSLAQPGCKYTSISTAQPTTPRVWDYFLAANQVIPSTLEYRLGSFPGAPSCGARAAAPGTPPVRVLTMTAKADGSVVPDIIEPFTHSPLIDRNLNFTMYEILLNGTEAAYIFQNRLNTVAGQEAAKSIDFPCGKLPGAKPTGDCPGPVGGVGSIEIKAAWRILDPARGDDPATYFVREQDLYIPADRSANHQAFCIPKAKLGLVALHILHKTASQPQWFWSSFEHRANAPTTTNTATCAGPSGDPTRYSYFQPQCPAGVCVPDAPPPGKAFLWARTPPYAGAYATASRFGTQVVRCQPIAQNSPSSPLVDARWLPKLAGTVWANYQLVGTQWGFGYTGAPPAPAPCFDGNTICAPPVLLNSVQETYMQKSVSKTNAKFFANGCIQCHAEATTVGTNQKPADFSFLLGRVSASSSLRAPAALHPPSKP
jgi:hypothetical protein